MDCDTPLWRLANCDLKTILFVGRFDLLKGADVMLQAFASMLKDRPDLKLIFVGPDRGLPAADGKLIHIREYCELLLGGNFRDRVDFTGPMGNREIAVLRTKAMLTVVASRFETRGYTLLEAMLQSCPVVSTDAGGCPESVINGVTGRLAKSGDAPSFASHICAILDDPIAAEAMGRAARRHVIEQHSATKLANESLELYSRVISQSAL
jgi:glycosyltransferase involved in cell wall biosynthesis